MPEDARGQKQRWVVAQFPICNRRSLQVWLVSYSDFPPKVLSVGISPPFDLNTFQLERRGFWRFFERNCLQLFDIFLCASFLRKLSWKLNLGCKTCKDCNHCKLPHHNFWVCNCWLSIECRIDLCDFRNETLVTGLQWLLVCHFSRWSTVDQLQSEAFRLLR